MSFIGGIVFAAPGAVMIMGMVSREENGRIAAAGPITNMVIAVIFLLVSLLLAPFIQNLWLSLANHVSYI